MLKRLFCLAALALLPAVALAEVTPGRSFDAERPNRFVVTGGQISDIKGTVQETSRRLSGLNGQPALQDNAESFTLEELGLDSSDFNIGLSYERMWKWLTLQLDASYFQAEASAAAPRDLLIGVDDVSFRGQDFDYQQLNAGERYDAEMDGAVLGLRAQVTPFTLHAGDRLQFVPWLHLGLFGIGSQYEINAGPATGVRQYDNPPRQYVRGGHSDGEAGVYAPEIGLGGELTLGLGERHGRPVNLVLQATYAIFDLKGDGDTLGIGSGTDNNLDVNYDRLELQGLVEIPANADMDFVFGIDYTLVTADGDSKATLRNDADALAGGQALDKHFDVKFELINFLAGVRW